MATRPKAKSVGSIGLNYFEDGLTATMIIYVSVFFAVVMFVLWLIFRKNYSRYEKHKANSEMPYKLNTSFLTAREASFFAVLHPLAAELGLHVFAKPRIADFVTVTLERYVKGSKFHTYFNQINRKHIDFLLCDKDFKPVAGFEVDDKTHLKPETKARDAFVDGLYKCVGLPVFHVCKWNDPAEIEKLIRPLLPHWRGDDEIAVE